MHSRARRLQSAGLQDSCHHPVTYHRHVRFLLHLHGHLLMEQCPREKPMFWISKSFPVFPPLSCYQDPPCSCQSDGSAGVFSRTGRHRKDESQKTAERKVPGRKAWSILGLGTDSTGWLKSTFTTIHSYPREDWLTASQYCTCTQRSCRPGRSLHICVPNTLQGKKTGNGGAHH